MSQVPEKTSHRLVDEASFGDSHEAVSTVMTSTISTSERLRATQEAVRQLYVTHAAEVRQVVGRLAPDVDADDVTHEVFEVAVRRSCDVVAADSPRAWLFGVAVKLAATRRRSARLRRFFGLHEAVDVAAVDSPSRTVEQRDAQREVERGLQALSQAKREVFVLFELRGLRGEEIAEALDVPLKTVWTRLHHARKEFAAAVQVGGAR